MICHALEGCISAGRCRDCGRHPIWSQSLCPHKPPSYMATLRVLDSRTPEQWVRSQSKDMVETCSSIPCS